MTILEFIISIISIMLRIVLCYLVLMFNYNLANSNYYISSLCNVESGVNFSNLINLILDWILIPIFVHIMTYKVTIVYIFILWVCFELRSLFFPSLNILKSLAISIFTFCYNLFSRIISFYSGLLKFFSEALKISPCTDLALIKYYPVKIIPKMEISSCTDLAIVRDYPALVYRPLLSYLYLFYSNFSFNFSKSLSSSYKGDLYIIDPQIIYVGVPSGFLDRYDNLVDGLLFELENSSRFCATEWREVEYMEVFVGMSILYNNSKFSGIGYFKAFESLLLCKCYLIGCGHIFYKEFVNLETGYLFFKENYKLRGDLLPIPADFMLIGDYFEGPRYVDSRKDFYNFACGVVLDSNELHLSSVNDKLNFLSSSKYICNRLVFMEPKVLTYHHSLFFFERNGYGLTPCDIIACSSFEERRVLKAFQLLKENKDNKYGDFDKAVFSTTYYSFEELDPKVIIQGVMVFNDGNGPEYKRSGLVCRDCDQTSIPRDKTGSWVLSISDEGWLGLVKPPIKSPEGCISRDIYFRPIFHPGICPKICLFSDYMKKTLEEIKLLNTYYLDCMARIEFYNFLLRYKRENNKFPLRFSLLFFNDSSIREKVYLLLKSLNLSTNSSNFRNLILSYFLSCDDLLTLWDTNLEEILLIDSLEDKTESSVLEFRLGTRIQRLEKKSEKITIELEKLSKVEEDWSVGVLVLGGKVLDSRYRECNCSFLVKSFDDLHFCCRPDVQYLLDRKNVYLYNSMHFFKGDGELPWPDSFDSEVKKKEAVKESESLFKAFETPTIPSYFHNLLSSYMDQQELEALFGKFDISDDKFENELENELENSDES